MGASAVPPIGERIRAERIRRGVSARGLAREIGVSASLISQIETDKSRPSVSTLYAITTALGISIEDLFDTGELAAPPATPATGEAPALEYLPDPSAGISAALAVLGQDRRRRVGPIVRPDEREVLTLDSGVTWELLGQVPDTHVDFLRITYQPGGSSSSTGLLMRHSGTEYGFVTSGELVLTLGFDEHHLRAGDAVSFDSTTPHGYRNDGDEPAVGIWFVLERSG
ncbi:MAG TPA: cupin domain-containing protein [Jiangellaceae bacterium]|nr:cupin domain-containing protein [Jiangellaceae bacterium]